VVMGSGSFEGDEVYSSEDLLSEMTIAIRDRVCPECGCGLSRFKSKDNKGMRCSKCGWEFCLFGVFKDWDFNDYLDLLISKVSGGG